MPRMTYANRALLARDRLQLLVDDTQARVVLPMMRQLGADDEHVKALVLALRRVQAHVEGFERWSDEEARRATIEAEARALATRSRNAKERAERQAQRRKAAAQAKWDERRAHERATRAKEELADMMHRDRPKPR